MEKEMMGMNVEDNREVDDIFMEYLKKARKHSKMTEEKEREVLLQIQSGDETARNELIESQLYNVAMMVKAKFNDLSPDTKMDLVQAGNEALFKAIKNFDLKLKTRFWTYAKHYVKNAITKSLSDNSGVIRLPIKVYITIQKMNRISQDYEMEYGRKPSLEVIADEMGVSVEKIWNLSIYEAEAQVGLSTNCVDDEEENGLVEYEFEDKKATNPEKEVCDKEIREELREAIKYNLTEREQRVVQKYYRLDEGKQYSLREIGEEEGLCYQRVGQINKEILSKLEKVLCNH